MKLMSEIPLDRRNFLRGASALTALSYSRVMGANDRVQLGVIGCGDRGRYDMDNFQKADVDVVAVCDIYGAADRQGPRESAPRQGLQRSPQAAGNERSGRGADRHARPLACPNRHRRAQRRQGRLRGKAADAHHRGRPAHRESRARERSHLPGGHAAALGQALSPGQSTNISIPASWARSRWRAPGGTATATICAARPHRCRRSPRISIGRISWDR